MTLIDLEIRFLDGGEWLVTYTDHDTYAQSEDGSLTLGVTMDGETVDVHVRGDQIAALRRTTRTVDETPSAVDRLEAGETA